MTRHVIFFLLGTRCPYGWDKIEGFDDCYKVVSSYASWFQASERCRLNGGHLASIHSAKESTAILTFIHTHIHHTFSGKDVWIGGHRLRGNDDWEWSDGTPWDFQYLGASTSKKDSEEYCLKMKMADGKWSDNFCHKIGKRLPYICKMKALNGK